MAWFNLEPHIFVLKHDIIAINHIDVGVNILISVTVCIALIYFLSRHEQDGSRPLIDLFSGSHDAFIFNSQVLRNSLRPNDLDIINYVQNTPGIESILTILFKIVNYIKRYMYSYTSINSFMNDYKKKKIDFPYKRLYYTDKQIHDMFNKLKNLDLSDRIYICI